MQKIINPSAARTIVLTGLLLFNLVSVFAVNQQQQSTVIHDTTTWILQADTAMSENDSLNASRAYYNLGRWFEHEQLRSRAYYYLHKSRDILTAMKHGRGMGVTSNYIAAMLSEEGRHTEAMEMYHESMEFFEQLGGEDLIPGAMINIANEYLILGENDSALQYAYNALDMRVASQDSNQLGYYYWQIGTIYETTGDTLRWNKNLQKSYSLRNVPVCFRADGLHNLYHDLGWYAFCQKQYDQSLAYYDTLYQLGIKNKSQGAVSNALLNKAEVYSALEKYDDALPLLLEARGMEVHNLLQNKLDDNNEIADLYLKTNQPEKAIVYLKENIQSAGSSFPVKRETTYRLLYRAYKKRGLMNDALLWHEKYISLNDSLTNEREQNILQELTIQYETEKKEQQIVLLNIDNKVRKQRNAIAWAISAILLMIVVLGVFIVNKRKRDAEQKEGELKQQLLRSQMNPHFLFNALGSIQSFMYQNEPKKAAGYLGNFASLTRSILENSTEETITLEEDIETLRNYIELEKMRLNGKFDYSINIDENLDAEFVKIPPMLLQPFVENAIKHGFKTLNAVGLLELSFTEMNGILHIEIKDNGIGIAQASQLKYSGHRSMSMEIFDQRRKVLSKKSNRNVECQIIDLSSENKEKCGTKVEIEIPLQ